MARDIHRGVDLLERVQRQLHAFGRRVRQHLEGIAHPGVAQAHDSRLVRPVVEQVGAAREPVGECHAHRVAAGRRLNVLPERPVDHHEGLARLHVARAVQRHPQLLRKQAFLHRDLRRQEPALAGHQHRGVLAHRAPVVGHGQLARCGPSDGSDARSRGATVQTRQCGAGRPVDDLRRRVLPQTQRHLLHAAHDQVLVLVATGQHHAQDFQHGVGEVGVPATGAEAHLPEHLAVAERELRKRLRLGDEVVESAVVPQRHERVPQCLEPGHVALAQRLLQFAETQFIERGGPGVGHLPEQGRQVGEGARVVRLTFQVHHRAAGGGREGVGERLRFQSQQIHIVEEGGGRRREAHAAELGHHALPTFEGLRAQPSAHARGLVDHRLEAQLHQLVGRGHAGHAGTDDGHLGAVCVGRQMGQALRVRQPVVVGEGEVRTEDGHGRVGRAKRFHPGLLQTSEVSSQPAVPHIMSATAPSSSRQMRSEFRRRPNQKAANPSTRNHTTEPAAAPRPNTVLPCP